jgi:hypothetical protein
MCEINSKNYNLIIKMVEKVLWGNALKMKWLLGSMAAGTLFLQYGVYSKHLKSHEVFGLDGNGGHMLKIITNLTDEEIAKLKFVRRMNWHWRGQRKLLGDKDTISD